MTRSVPVLNRSLREAHTIQRLEPSGLLMFNYFGFPVLQEISRAAAH